MSGWHPNWGKDLPTEVDETYEVDSFVYFIAAGRYEKRGAVVKIGVAGDPQYRLRDLQTAHHLPLTVIAAVPGGEADEAALHERFASCRIRGEWFRVTPELRAFVDRVRTSS